jgi:hypothetical protein
VPTCLLPLLLLVIFLLLHAVTAYFFFSTRLFSCFHKFQPPSSAAAFSIPFCLSVTTAPADVCSAVQAQ